MALTHMAKNSLRSYEKGPHHFAVEFLPISL